MGIFWGLCSVIITSVAQLSLGYAMDNLPPMLDPLMFIDALFSASVGAFTLYAGLVGYLLSVICWHKALHQMALSKAYALLSLSYVLVWIASMILPGWQGAFSLRALFGVLCIMAGLMTIFLVPNPATHGEKP
jgi:undecaprenyl phosphate-alpha-L-ara4N flippase subunit ArnF